MNVHSTQSQSVTTAPTLSTQQRATHATHTNHATIIICMAERTKTDVPRYPCFRWGRWELCRVCWTICRPRWMVEQRQTGEDLTQMRQLCSYHHWIVIWGTFVFSYADTFFRFCSKSPPHISILPFALVQLPGLSRITSKSPPEKSALLRLEPLVLRVLLPLSANVWDGTVGTMLIYLIGTLETSLCPVKLPTVASN